jgi:hypothetical protein
MIPDSDYPNQPDRSQEIARTAGHGNHATAAGPKESAWAARSVDCACTAPARTPCSPSGDHLARYLRAEQSGALTRQALTDVIADLDVIAPHVVIQSFAGQAAPHEEATASAQGDRAHLEASISADRASVEPEPEAEAG